VKTRYFIATGAIALVSLPASAFAQHMGHEMPAPAEPAQPTEQPAPPEADHSTMDHSAMPSAAAPASETPAQDHGQMDHSQMDHSQMAGMEHGGHSAMTGALGAYPMAREASGTAWQPDASEHEGIHLMSGDWTLMAHGSLNLVYDHQSGRRGDDKLFAAGMLMGMARRPD
jgi:uncharacterized protein involved in copper resistance